MEKINADNDGVKIHDRKRECVAQIYFKRTGIYCDVDKTDSCEHIDFALSLRDVQKLIREKKAQGWKLPDV